MGSVPIPQGAAVDAAPQPIPQGAEIEGDTPARLPASNFASGSKVPNAILNGSDTTGEIVGGTALAGGAAVAANELLPSVVPHTIEGVKAITAWAAKNPLHAYALYNIIKELVPGAKKAIGLVKAAPE